MADRFHPATAYRFGSFVLEPAQQRVINASGRPVPLTPKAFDTLLCLVEHNGALVSKQDLLERVWPNVIVEEAILARNVADVRKALGDDAAVPRFIETLPKRGYRFIADVTVQTGEGAPSGPASFGEFQRPVDTLQLVAEKPISRAVDTIVDAPELKRDHGHNTRTFVWLIAGLILAGTAVWLVWHRA
jgi:DNA-binding winged helix-turn-helix (wHTH) protein